MDQLQTMKVFVRVAQRAGFAAAARDLSMSPAAVTKHVAALESRIRTRLFDRTTRSVSLTEAGRAYLERCLECLQAFDDAEDSVNRAGNKPAGRLRVTAPVDFGPGIMASLARYMKRYEDVTVDLQLSNRPVDLVDEGFDVAAGMEPLLVDWTVLPQLRLFALYPHRRFLPAKVRLFVETLREDLGDPESDPWWPTIAAAANRKTKARR